MRGNDVEGDQPLGGGIVTVDGKGDARAPKQGLSFAALALEGVDLLRLQPFMNRAVGLADLVSAPVHLVKCS